MAKENAKMAGFVKVKCVRRMEVAPESVDNRSGRETDDVWIKMFLKGAMSKEDSATALEVHRTLFLVLTLSADARVQEETGRVHGCAEEY